MPRNNNFENLEKYFRSGFSYDEILLFLQQFDRVDISKRSLHRKLRERGLFRRKNHSAINDVLSVTHNQLQGSGSNFGYRLMHHKLQSTTDRETVRHCLTILDPIGVLRRRNHRFQRKRYLSRGPNFTRQLDGYDKLKPYVFAILCSMDIWSRKVLWLYVGSSNNDPRITGCLFVRTINKLNLFPRIVRTDRGSENVVIAGCQPSHPFSYPFSTCLFETPLIPSPISILLF